MSERDFYAPGFSLKIGGQDLSQIGFIVQRLTVEQSVEAAARLSFSLFRAGTEKTLAHWLEEALSLLKLGLLVEAWAGYGGKRLLIFKGCLTSFSYAFSVDSVGEIQVEAQDFLFLMMKRKALRSRGQDGFSEVYDHEIVKRLLLHYPSFEKQDIDQTSVKYPKVQQKKEEHDYQFLKRLAERNGYFLYARLDQQEEKSVFCFQKPRDKAGGEVRGHELSFGRELRSFSPQFSLTQVVTKVVVRGWDPKNKKEIEGQAELPAAEQRRLEEANFIDPLILEVHQPVRDRKEAEERARALLFKHRRLLEAEAETLGLTELQAGDLVKIRGLPSCTGPYGLDLCRVYLAHQVTHQIGETGYRLRLKLKEVMALP